MVHAQQFAETVFGGVKRNAMMETKMIMTVVRQVANLSHVMSAAHVMDGSNLGSMGLARIFVVTT
jgi:hypothetical protein